MIRLPSDLAHTRYTTRHKDWYALQEAFGEIHIRDLTNNYDFISSRFGIQPFVSDFRGFIFNDTNLGVRIFGNYDNNLWQYNVIAFDMLREGHLFRPEQVRRGAISRSSSRTFSARIFSRRATPRN